MSYKIQKFRENEALKGNALTKVNTNVSAKDGLEVWSPACLCHLLWTTLLLLEPGAIPLSLHRFHLHVSVLPASWN